VDYEQALGAEMSLTKRAANGTMLWCVLRQTSTTAWERPAGRDRQSGNAIVCGTLMSGYSNPVEAASIVMKFDPNGAMPGGVSMKPASMAHRSANASSMPVTMSMCSAGQRPNGRVTRSRSSPRRHGAVVVLRQCRHRRAAEFKLTPDGALLITGRYITAATSASPRSTRWHLIWTYPRCSA